VKSLCAIVMVACLCAELAGFRRYAPAHKFCMILDCRGLSAKNMDWKLLRMAAPILENNYPERQFATYVLPVVSSVLIVHAIITSHYSS
jgi:CRAL/TRIO domain